jgi:heme exporter protein C
MTVPVESKESEAGGAEATGAARSRRGLAPWKWALLPWMLVVTGLAYLWAQPLVAFMEPEAARIIFWHVPMAWLGLLWFWIGAYYGIRLLTAQRGKAEVFDTRSAAANELGLLCTVLATVTGMVFANVQWGVPWNWDPKQVTITVLIAIYLAYFGLRMSIEPPDQRARLAAVYSIFGAVATPFLIYLIPQLPQLKSLHPGDTIATGLDTKWRIIYTMSFIGFLGITCWVHQLRVRVALFENRRPEERNGAEPRLEPVRRPPMSGS